MEFGVAIVRNRAIYEMKEKSKVALYIYIQDERIDLTKLQQDIEQITYQNCEIIIITTKNIARKEDCENLKKCSKIKKIVVTDKIIAKLNELSKTTECEQIIFAKDIQDIKTKTFICCAQVRMQPMILIVLEHIRIKHTNGVIFLKQSIMILIL